MAYFNLLLANNEFAEAEKALDDAVKYAVTDEAGKFAVDISRANLCSLAAGSEIDSAGDFNQKAYDLLSELIVSPLGTPQQKNELVLSLAELCIKMGRTDEAIDLLTVLAEKPGAVKEEAPETDGTALPAAPDPAEIDALRERDMQRMDALVAEGMVDESIGELAEVTYDENGSPVRNYPEGTFDDIPEGADPVKFGLPTPEKLVELERQAELENAAELNARVNFMLLSCYSTKNDFEKVLEYAAAVKTGAKESYYSFFGHYAEAFAALQLAKEGKRFTLEEAQDKYDRELAFFRNETMKRTPSSNYALLFRARMYAELGKYDKAAELSELLDPDDKAAVEQYIEDCRRDAEKN